MSRVDFAKRFKTLVGQSMFDYFTYLRRPRATELLRDTGASLFEVAGQAGYESDLSFTKTFKNAPE